MNTGDPGERWRGTIVKVRGPKARRALLLVSLLVMGLASWLDWVTGPGREPASSKG